MNKTLDIQVPSSAPGCKARKALNIKGFRAFPFFLSTHTLPDTLCDLAHLPPLPRPGTVLFQNSDPWKFALSKKLFQW